jgi:hypothetical protein
VGQTVVVRAKANSLLPGINIASYRFTLPSGVVSVFADAQGFGQTTIVTTGSIGSVIQVKVQAVDSLGNESVFANHSITLGTNFVNKAVITSPANETALVSNGINIVTAAFATTGISTDTLARTEFEIRTGNATLLWSAQSTGLSITVPDGVLPAGTTVFIRARHVGNSLGIGQWSDAVQITTAPVLTPSAFGAPYQGGFYAGNFQLGTNLFALVVAPLSQETALGANTNSEGVTSGGAMLLTTEAKSITDGLANTNELVTISPTQFPAAKYCWDLTYAGYSDWYLPSLLEMELAYRTLKPSTSANNTVPSPTSDLTLTGTLDGYQGAASNENLTALPGGATEPARPANYTNAGGIAALPALTNSAAFQGSGVQEGFNSARYWTSSGPSGNNTGRGMMSSFSFANGGWQGHAGIISELFGAVSAANGTPQFTTEVQRVRPMRRVFLRSVP